jgi:hypothetical protein
MTANIQCMSSLDVWLYKTNCSGLTQVSVRTYFWLLKTSVVLEVSSCLKPSKKGHMFPLIFLKIIGLKIYFYQGYTGQWSDLTVLVQKWQ